MKAGTQYKCPRCDAITSIMQTWGRRELNRTRRCTKTSCALIFRTCERIVVTEQLRATLTSAELARVEGNPTRKFRNADKPVGRPRAKP